MIFDPLLTLGYVEMIKVFLHPINAVPYYTSPIVHWPYITLALNYTGPKLHRPYSTLALLYTSPILHWPYTTPALYCTCLLLTTFNLTTNHGQNYRYFRPCYKFNDIKKKLECLLTNSKCTANSNFRCTFSQQDNRIRHRHIH